MLIVFAGLPGTGKTTLARTLAEATGAVYLRIDSIETAMKRSVLAIHPAEDAGYRVGYALAEDNLRLGRTVVADCVNAIDLTRNDWRQAADRAGKNAVEVEVICSDRNEHRQRVEARLGDIEGARLPNWQDVQDRHYDPWTRDHIVIDTASRSVATCLEDLLSQLAAADWQHNDTL